MNNEAVLRDFAKGDDTLLDRYDRSRAMYEKLMDKSLEMRFQQWVNRQCSAQILKYEDCVADKWPWQLHICRDVLNSITKCRLNFNTRQQREEFLQKERELLQEMDDKGETLFDHELWTHNYGKH
eukprot:CAMPEP_0202705118 /NCGR_PEP_ID=MMETSP1385-20130828/17711_1 /ASSEMBLY_ACC=CAM_ASM_000861 /TAXON_ID=933848 /ORGANISM="Elphidium margaritaceum" /LENGTH=124 /DNA_ID=CAMNT_0049363281 /DNA_START=15 /DNA_END=389 /DNA_ORIENTATION=-